jgi:elongation factor P
VLEHEDGKLYVVLSHETFRPGKGTPTTTIIMRRIIDGVKTTAVEPVVKGQTASSSYKPAMLDIGIKTMVPPHIGPGTRVIISTEDGSYVERAKD